jgi:hypothetical protein
MTLKIVYLIASTICSTLFLGLALVSQTYHAYAEGQTSSSIIKELGPPVKKIEKESKREVVWTFTTGASYRFLDGLLIKTEYPSKNIQKEHASIETTSLKPIKPAIARNRPSIKTSLFSPELSSRFSNSEDDPTPTSNNTADYGKLFSQRR